MSRSAALIIALALGTLACTGASEIDGSAGRGGRGAGAGRGGAAALSGESGSSGTGAGAAAGESGGPAPVFDDAEAILNSSCYRRRAQTEVLPANILFVIDRSGSMACNPPPTTDSQTCEEDSTRAVADQPTKWEITQTALIESLEALPDSARVGVSYFSNDDGCGVYPEPSVPISRNSPAQREVIAASLRNVKPGGATPLVGATVLAYQHIHDHALAGLIRGNKFVVLVTDGKQSEACGDPPRCSSAEQCTQLLIDVEVPKAAALGVGIRTFVIGVPGSEQDQRTLSRVALAGKTARAGCDEDRDCHFDLSAGGDFGAALQQALVDVIGQTRTCDIATPTEGELDELNLLYQIRGNSQQIVRQDTSKPCDDGAQGWQPGEAGKIRLCGAFCELVKADPSIELEFVIGCPVQGPL